jgi:hypothetical protein
MNGFLSLPTWSPYLVGVCIGLLGCLAFVVSDKPIGCSTAFVKTFGLIEKIFRGEKVHEKEYYKKFTPSIDWQFMIVPGIAIGAFISSSLSGTFGFLLFRRSGLNSSEIRHHSGSLLPLPGEFSLVSDHGGQVAAQAGMELVEHSSSRWEAFFRRPASLSVESQWR